MGNNINDGYADSNRLSDKALLIYNDFLHSGKFLTHYKWLKNAAETYDIKLELMGNSEFMCSYGTSFDKELIETLGKYRFILFWDKDIRLGKKFTNICKKINIPIYNNIRAIADCDDKSATYEKIGQWNDCHDTLEQIKMIPTIVAPMTYENIGYTDMNFLDKVAEKFGFPLVIKECFGSFGMQVYMAHDMDELKKRVSDIGGKPMIFQKFIEKSSGFDVRLQVVGDEVAAAMYRYTDDGDFRANITHGGKMKSYEPDASEIKLATDTVKALGLDFAGVDLLFSNGADMPADMVCEVNSNAHFKNIFECTGVNVADEIMKYIMSH